MGYASAIFAYLCEQSGPFRPDWCQLSAFSSRHAARPVRPSGHRLVHHWGGLKRRLRVVPQHATFAQLLTKYL